MGDWLTEWASEHGFATNEYYETNGGQTGVGPDSEQQASDGNPDGGTPSKTDEPSSSPKPNFTVRLGPKLPKEVAGDNPANEWRGRIDALGKAEIEIQITPTLDGSLSDILRDPGNHIGGKVEVNGRF